MRIRVYLLLFVFAALLIISGCRSFYRETGISVTTGDVTAPIEISDASDLFTVRALFGMDGMRLWAARGYGVYFEYDHSYTNSYLFGMVVRHGIQHSKGVVADTNNFPAFVSSPCLNINNTNSLEGAERK